MAPSRPLKERPLLVAIALGGFLAAVGGTYWDDAWHTEEGRDSFFIAPHVLLYAGISATGASLGLWALLTVRADGLRAVISHPPLVLSLVGIGLTLGAAPIDNAWHVAFGRDAVVWSPPHMLGVAGTAAVAAGILLELGTSARSQRELAIAVIAAAGVVGAGAIPVLEYETDVPQFDLAFYLPVLATGTAFAFGLLRVALPLNWPAVAGTFAYMVVMLVVILALTLGDRVAPLVPLLVAPALVFDLTRRAPVWAQAASLVAVLFAVYVPYLNWIGSGLFLEFEDVALGAPLALLGAAIALSLTSKGDRGGGRARGRRSAFALLVALLVLPPTALGHDPGQGPQLTTAAMTAEVHGRAAEIVLVPASHCNDLEAAGITARRADEVLDAELVERDCVFSGRVRLPARGRWFVYAELSHDDRAVEAWLPIESKSGEAVSEEDRSLYFPPAKTGGPSKAAAGISIYGVVVGTFLSIAAFYRRVASPHET